MGAIQLSDVKSCPIAANFYHRYREPISKIETLSQRDNMLSAMQKDYERYVKAYPQERDELLETYQLLVKKCMEVL